jgi:hypothetical protein
MSQNKAVAAPVSLFGDGGFEDGHMRRRSLDPRSKRRQEAFSIVNKKKTFLPDN